MTAAPEPNFAHLLSLSGPFGTFEHADHEVARVEHGYCTDDVARVLLACVREEEPESQVVELARTSLHFLESAQSNSGRFVNRRLPSGSWRGLATSDDCWGRALWAVGTVVARSSDSSMRRQALEIFERGSRAPSQWPRAMAFAVLGAGEVRSAHPTHRGARELTKSAVRVLDRAEVSEDWRWPEERLTYANAVLADALHVAGRVLGDDRLVTAGLRQLEWLLAAESLDGHLSVTPSGGRGPQEPRRRFDQQPIEVAALSEACVRAFDLTGDVKWLDGHQRAVRWFMGDNDVSAVMYDPHTGGGFDGLTPGGANLNQGAESTLAVVTTLQHARRFARVMT
jgi:hypothetical protein